MAIGYAVDFYRMIGAQRKEERLHFLKNYWMERVSEVPGIQLFTSLHPKFGCAIGCFGINGKKPAEITEALFRDWKIHTVGIEWEKINGVRVTPNVYTTIEELDKLVLAIKKLA
jgi:selenocysteine lyase/cysteine desulfurase